MLLSASILAANISQLGADVSNMDAAGADWIHLDCFDGHFVPTLTFGPAIVQAVRGYTQRPLDIHFMAERPWQYFPALAEVQKITPHNLRVTVHVEACTQVAEVIATLRQHKIAVGLALLEATPASAVLPYLADIDQVLVMTVRGGYGGDPFLPHVLPKIAELRTAINALPPAKQPLLAVDGGISLTTAPLVAQAGANVLCAGSALFKGHNWAENVVNLRAAAQ
ncbi:MAG: ribulose-phosphate 3-epimerase [Alphaproteobacteria bacterium]